MPRKSRVTSLRDIAGTITRAVRSVTNPASLFKAPELPAQPVEPAEDPADVYGLDDMPELADIEAAAAEYNRAADQGRRADRGKRAAKKILDRLPAGQYGGWLVERIASNRQTADLQEIARIFKQHGLGPVPMKSAAPSLKVKQAPTLAAPVEFETLAAVAL